MEKEYKFKIKEGREADYERLKSNNSDVYGSVIMQYAERWGGMMEERMAEGYTLAEAADKTRLQADKWFITGAMENFGGSVLATFWEHGDEFFEWYNNRYQFETSEESSEPEEEQAEDDFMMQGF